MCVRGEHTGTNTHATNERTNERTYVASLAFFLLSLGLADFICAASRHAGTLHFLDVRGARVEFSEVGAGEVAAGQPVDGVRRVRAPDALAVTSPAMKPPLQLVDCGNTLAALLAVVWVRRVRIERRVDADPPPVTTALRLLLLLLTVVVGGT